MRSTERLLGVALLVATLTCAASCDVCFSACGTAIFESCWLPGGGLAPRDEDAPRGEDAPRDEIAPR